MPFGHKFTPKYHKPSGNPVWGEGPSPANVMLIGERPGKDEDSEGRPFVGLAGKELDRYLDSVGIRREDCYVTNLVKTYEDRDPTKLEVDEWREVLKDEIESVMPKFIATLGAFATRELLGDVHMDMAHGIPFLPLASGSILSRDTRYCQSSGSPLIIPIFHPASGFYNPEQGKFIQYDFEQFAAVIQGKVHPLQDKFDNPLYADVTEINNKLLIAGMVAIDTEGWRHNPWGMTITNVAGYAMCIRSKGKIDNHVVTHDGMLHILLHNSLHDISVLDTLGVEVPEGKFTDTMVLAYLLGCEPQGLKDLAFRHAGMKMKSYMDVLANANLEKAMIYLMEAAYIDWGETPSYSFVKIVDGEQKLIVKQPWSLNKYISRILSDVQAKDADPRKRWENIDDHIKEPVIAAMGEMPEATLDDIPLNEAVDYACRDADATYRIYPILKERVIASGQELVSKIDHDIIPMVNRMQIIGMGVDLDHFARLANKCEVIMAEKVEAIKQLTGCYINPNSPDQTEELLFDVLGLPATKFTKGGKSGLSKRSTQDKVLEELRDSPVVELIMAYREASKVKASFCLPIARSAIKSRVHPNIRITRVSSGRLSATAPNLLAIPVRSELGREVRQGFIPAPGHLLGTWDLNQVEMRHMANESRDALLCQLFIEGVRDVHGETGSRMFAVPYEMAMADSMRYRYPAKRVGFGVITGITGKGLVDQMRLAKTDIQWTEQQCDMMIDDWFKVYPGVKQYMETCKTECRRFNLVRDCWGRVRYLPAIHSPSRHLREEAGRQAHSHKIQAGAQGLIKIAMKAIWDEIKELRKDFYIENLLQIHDELIFEFDDNEFVFQLLDEIVVRNLTTAHKKYLPDYIVPLRAKGVSGPNWAALEK